MGTRLVPLTPIEQEVAARNIHLVYAFLRANRLSVAEYYDVVIFRYLLAIEKWFSRPDLYKYEFSNIVWSAMRSAVGHEKEKQKRRIQTVSLDEIIPGTHGLTRGDLITADNLDYINYIEEVC